MRYAKLLIKILSDDTSLLKATALAALSRAYYGKANPAEGKLAMTLLFDQLTAFPDQFASISHHVFDLLELSQWFHHPAWPKIFLHDSPHSVSEAFKFVQRSILIIEIQDSFFKMFVDIYEVGSVTKKQIQHLVPLPSCCVLAHV